MKDISY